MPNGHNQARSLTFLLQQVIIIPTLDMTIAVLSPYTRKSHHLLCEVWKGALCPLEKSNLLGLILAHMPQSLVSTTVFNHVFNVTVFNHTFNVTVFNHV